MPNTALPDVKSETFISDLDEYLRNQPNDMLGLDFEQLAFTATQALAIVAEVLGAAASHLPNVEMAKYTLGSAMTATSVIENIIEAAEHLKENTQPIPTYVAPETDPA